MKQKLKIDMRPEDMRLERDPRYVAEKELLTGLQLQFSAAEKERDHLVADIGALSARAREDITAEAVLLLSKAQPPTAAVRKREQLTDSLGQIYHRMAVLGEAIRMQRERVESLRLEVSRVICADVAPSLDAIVRAEIAAVSAVAEIRKDEADIINMLHDNGVVLTDAIRPMLIQGFDLRDSNCLASRTLLERVRFKQLAVSELPVALRAHVPSDWLKAA
jgi:hypothetical protein